MASCGEALIRILEGYGVEVVFGSYPAARFPAGLAAGDMAQIPQTTAMANMERIIRLLEACGIVDSFQVTRAVADGRLRAEHGRLACQAPLAGAAPTLPVALPVLLPTAWRQRCLES